MDDNQATPQKPPKVKQPGSGKGGLIVFVLVVLLVIAAGAVIALDLFGFRERVLMPPLRNIPLVSDFFPEEEEEIDEMPFEELQARYNAAQIQIESLQNQNAILMEEINDALLRIAGLVRFEERWSEYRVARAQMDQYIAHGDPISFVQFFGNVSEENIDDLVTEAELLIEFEERLMTQVRTMNAMDESAAGQILSDLLLRETEMMVRLIERMSPGRVAEIMETMEEDVRTNVFIIMSPDVPGFEPLLPPFPPFPLYLPDLPDLYAMPPTLPANGLVPPPPATEEPPEEEPPAEEEEPPPDAITTPTEDEEED